MQDLRELYINGFFDGYAFGLEEESALLQTLDIPFYKWCFLGISKDKLDELLEAVKSNRPSVVRRFVEDSFADLKARSDDIDVHLPFGGMDITLVYVHKMLSKLNQYLDKFNGEIAEVYSRIKQGGSTMKKFHVYDIEFERNYNEINYRIYNRGELGSEVYKAIEDADEEMAKHDEIIVEVEDEKDINDEFIKEYFSNTLDIYVECHDVCNFEVEEVEEEEDE